MVKWTIALVILFSIAVVAQQPPVPPTPGQGQGAAAPPAGDGQKGDIFGYESIQGYLAPFTYEGEIYRDPFQPSELAIPLRPGETYGPFLPLQMFRLDQLTLKGVFWNTRKPTAIFNDSKNKTHQVGIKDYVGENFGYIASIREKEVIIIQTIENNGKRYSTTKVVFLDRSGSKK